MRIRHRLYPFPALLMSTMSLSNCARNPVALSRQNDLAEISHEAAVQSALAASLKFEPGAGYLYSDTGYGMLAVIVEVVSGQPFQAYLHQHLFEPASMETTGFYNEPQWTDLTVAHGYNNDRDLGCAATRPGPTWGLLGFGGVLTTTLTDEFSEYPDYVH